MAHTAHSRTFLRALCLLLVVAGVTYPLWRPTPKFQGRPVRDWVNEAIHGEWTNNAAAREVVTKTIPRQAIPFLIDEINAHRHPRLRYKLFKWQLKLPRRLWLLPDVADTRGTIGIVATLLGEMGEVARPAIPALIRSMDESPMHLWERQDVMGEIIYMGPAATDALPLLRRMALNPHHGWSVQAGLAIYQADNSLDCLAAAISNNLAFSQGSELDCRELFWFRKDPDVIECVESQLRRVSTNGANVRWSLRDDSPDN